MSERVTLVPRAALPGRLEVEGLAPDRLASLSEREIAGLPLWIGKRRGSLGDLFDVRGERAPRMCVEGDASQIDGIGAGMAGGELIVLGGAGRDLGAGMTGGRIEVRGSVGHAAGAGMSGGLIRVGGSAGERLGGARPGASRGMTGGEIIVRGSAARDAAVRCRRGLIVVGGRAGAGAARSMIAGTLVVLKDVGDDPARGCKRGSLVVGGKVDVPQTFRYASTFEPAWVRFLLTYLRRQHQFEVDDDVVNGRFRRFCGEIGTPGRGEILTKVEG